MKKKRLAIIGALRGGIGHYISHISPYLRGKYHLYYISYNYYNGAKLVLGDVLIANYVKKAELIIDCSKPERVLTSLKQTIDFIKKYKINAVNIHIATWERNSAYFYIALIVTLKKLNVPVIYTFHDVEPFEKYEGGDDLLKALYCLNDYATVGNAKEKEKLAKRFGYKKLRNLVIVPHGIYNLFDFGKYDKNSARKSLDIPPDKKVVATFGYLRPYKGLDDLIKAFKLVIKDVPDAFLYVNCGTRIWGDPQEFENLAKKEKIWDHCRLVFKKNVKTTKIEAIFKASDIICLLYKKVSQSGILNLAFAFNKPIIVSKLFTEAKQINRKMGLVTKPGDTRDIANKIKRLFQNDQLMEKCIKNINKYNKNRAHSWQKTSDMLIRAIEKALNKKMII